MQRKCSLLFEPDQEKETVQIITLYCKDTVYHELQIKVFFLYNLTESSKWQSRRSSLCFAFSCSNQLPECLFEFVNLWTILSFPWYLCVYDWVLSSTNFVSASLKTILKSCACRISISGAIYFALANVHLSLVMLQGYSSVALRQADHLLVSIPMHHLLYSTALSKPSKTNKMKFCQDIINNNYSCTPLILEHHVYIRKNPMRALYLIFEYQTTSSLTTLLHYLSMRTLYLAISYKILDSFHVLSFLFEILELVPNKVSWSLTAFSIIVCPTF